MKVAIYSRVYESDQKEDIQRLLQELDANNIRVVIYRGFFEQIRQDISFNHEPLLFHSYDDLDDTFECMISLGGDGTLLDTVTMVRDQPIPLLGINFGRLGFLASIGREELETVVASLKNHTYVEDERTLIHLDSNMPLFGDTP
jgi:NAD+ kinase